MKLCIATFAMLAIAPLSGLAQVAPNTTSSAAGTVAQDVNGKEIVKLSPFTVTSGTGYQSSSTVSATRTNVKSEDLPMGIEVLTNQAMMDFNIQEPSAILGLLSSVSTDRDNGSFTGVDLARANQLRGGTYIRGLPVNTTLQDGMRQTLQSNSAMIEAVELLKGPAGVLYGLTQPGGIFNAITKKPVYTKTFGSIKAQYGRFDQSQFDLDLNRAFGSDIAVRFIASDRRQDTEYMFNRARSKLYNGMVSFRPFKETELVVSLVKDKRWTNIIDNRQAYGNIVGVIPEAFYRSLGYTGPFLGTFMQVPVWEMPRHANWNPKFNWTGPDSYRKINLTQLDVTIRQRVFAGLNFQLQFRNTDEVERRFQNNITVIGPSTSAVFFNDVFEPFMLGKWEAFDTKRDGKQLVFTGIWEKKMNMGRLGESRHQITMGFQGYEEKRSQRESVDQRDLRKRDSAGKIITPPSTPYFDTVKQQVLAGLPAAQAASNLLNYPSLNGGLLDTRPNRPPGGVWFTYVPLRTDFNVNLPTTAGLRSPGTNFGEDFLTLLPPGVGSFSGIGNGAFQHDTNQTAWIHYHGSFADNRIILMGGVFFSEIFDKDGRGWESLTVNYDKKKTLPQAGIIIRPFKHNKGLSFFGLYSESLDSNSSRRNALGKTFPPSIGVGKEYGLKFNIIEEKLTGTISYYDVKVTNRVIFDPNEPNPTIPQGSNQAGDLVARGFSKSTGLDASLTYVPLPNLSTILTFTSTKVTTGGNPQPWLNGTREIGSFDHSYGVIANYRFSTGLFRRLGVGLAVNYVDDVTREGSRLASDGVPFQRTTPSYWDGAAFVSYPTKIFGRDWVFRGNINNLFEKKLYLGWNPYGKLITASRVPVEPYSQATERVYFISAEYKF